MTSQDQADRIYRNDQPDRLNAIRRAVALFAPDITDPATLADYIAQTDAHDNLKADPAALRAALVDSTQPSRYSNFGAWKIAQQMLRAAGQPY